MCLMFIVVAITITVQDADVLIGKHVKHIAHTSCTCTHIIDQLSFLKVGKI